MMKSLFLIAGLALVACGGHPKHQDDPLPGDEPVDADTRTPIEVRRDAACEQLGPKMTECAIADARRTMTPEELAELHPEEVRPVHTREFIKGCKAQTLSSRQVRVYEVCMKEETECDALIACLDNAKPDAATSP